MAKVQQASRYALVGLSAAVLGIAVGWQLRPDAPQPGHAALPASMPSAAAGGGAHPARACAFDPLLPPSRRRDEEVALIVACRVAGAQRPRSSAQLGAIQESLAELYADAAPEAAGLDDQIDRWDRAHRMLAAALKSYTTALGPDDPKTLEARSRLAALGKATLQGWQSHDG
jgi:hypothetical protein